MRLLCTPKIEELLKIIIQRCVFTCFSDFFLEFLQTSLSKWQTYYDLRKELIWKLKSWVAVHQPVPTFKETEVSHVSDGILHRDFTKSAQTLCLQESSENWTLSKPKTGLQIMDIWPHLLPLTPWFWFTSEKIDTMHTLPEPFYRAFYFIFSHLIKFHTGHITDQVPDELSPPVICFWKDISFIC